jgi:hypothetical protein
MTKYVVKVETTVEVTIDPGADDPAKLAREVALELVEGAPIDSAGAGVDGGHAAYRGKSEVTMFRRKR